MGSCALHDRLEPAEPHRDQFPNTGLSIRPFVDHSEPLRLVRAQRQNDPSSGFDLIEASSPLSAGLVMLTAVKLMLGTDGLQFCASNRRHGLVEGYYIDLVTAGLRPAMRPARGPRAVAPAPYEDANCEHHRHSGLFGSFWLAHWLTGFRLCFQGEQRPATLAMNRIAVVLR